MEKVSFVSRGIVCLEILFFQFEKVCLMKCGFLSEGDATHLGLSKNIEQLVNSFNMKPRDYYTYIHGSPPKHTAAFELCLRIIKQAGRNIGWAANIQYGAGKHLICKFAQHKAWRLHSCLRVGAVFSEDTNVTIAKTELLHNLVEMHYYKNGVEFHLGFRQRFLGRIPTTLRRYFWR